MDAPTCRLCGAKHYANAPHKFSTSPGPVEPVQKKKSKKIKIREGFYGAGGGPLTSTNLLQRVEILEALVMELLEGKKKRSDYMKNYMRDYRQRGG